MTPRELKSKRTELKLSQFALAKLAKVSRYNISIFESGFYQFSESDMNRIENAIKKKEEARDARNR